MPDVIIYILVVEQNKNLIECCCRIIIIILIIEKYLHNNCYLMRFILGIISDAHPAVGGVSL